MNKEQVKEIIEQIGYQEFYRYFQEKTTLIEWQRKEIERLNNIINNFDKLIDELYKELYHREHGDSYIYDYDGDRIIMDVGYAFEGIEFFIKELKHKLKDGNK